MARGRTSGAVRVLTGAAVIAAWVMVAVVTWPGTAGRDQLRSPPDLAAAEHPVQTQSERGAPLLVGPITYFNAACAQCHGDYGDFLAVELGEVYAGEGALRQVVKEMVFGQAQSSLGEREIDALTAYRRSLLGGGPFLAWTGASEGELRGEVTPGASVEVLLEGAWTGVTVRGHEWSAPVAAAAEFRATLNGEVTTLVIPGAAFSHGGRTENHAPR